MWFFIFGAMGLAALASIVYLVMRIGKTGLVQKLVGDKKAAKLLISFVPVAVVLAVLYLAMDMINMLVCMIHILIIWIIVDLLNLLVEKIRKKKTPYNGVAVAAVLICVVYLSAAWFQAHDVKKTDYALATEKSVGSLRVIQFADSHVGATFDGKDLEKYVDEMQAQNPDVVVVTGDFVDDDTSKQDMIDACAALGKFNTKYGVYFVYGNHDKGYYPAEYRGYSGEDLAAELEKNHVKILEDETVLIDNRFYLIGRQDRSEEQKGGSRASMEELMQGLDTSKYCIVLDHQPHDYEAQEKAGADLVLSGHTHGGQFFPINYVGEWTGENDKTYGLETRNLSEFIVTSGIADWAIKFKTGCRSEYVVIDISQKENAQ